MRIPAPLFRVINPLMSLLLRSWLHGVISSSVLLLSFAGRRSGRRIAFPLRYSESDQGFVCFTTDDATWWRNFDAPRAVDVLVAGETLRGAAFAERVTMGESLDALRSFLQQYPSDAIFHDVSVVQGAALETDLVRATNRSIRVHIARQVTESNSDSAG